MGNLVAAASAGIAGTCVTLIGAHCLGAFGHGSGKVDLPKSTEEFQKINKQGRCFSPSLIFDKWVPNGKIGESSSDVNEIETNGFIKGDDSSSVTESNGCVEYEGRAEDKKLEGSYFRFIWVLSKGKQAFSIYLTATGKANKSFEFDGVGHVFRKEDGGGKTERKLGIKESGKTLNFAELGDKFPQKGNVFPDGENLNKYWNFLRDDGTDLLGSQNGDGKHVIFRGKDDGSGNEADSGSSNMTKWGEHFFDKSKGSMNELVRNTKGEGMLATAKSNVQNSSQVSQ